MSIYVDELADWGWVMYGKTIQSCHMVTDGDMEELHKFAESIGLKRSYFQDGTKPHYDLTPKRRAKAIEMGAVRIGRHELVELFREQKKKDAAL